jgi:two-component system chemotaxis sensor kinase CheA
VKSKVKDEQIEIIREFIQETRDMVEQLEPIIIELGQSCKPVDCWDVTGCGTTDCARYNKTLDFPCWLHIGYIEMGSGTCTVGESKQDCFNCEVYQSINGDNQKINAIFRLFHSMKGSAGFLELEHIAKVAHSSENLLDLIRSGSIRLHPQHITILCESCDFTKEALDYLEENFKDDGMADKAKDVNLKLLQVIKDTEKLMDTYRKEAGVRAVKKAPEKKAASAKKASYNEEEDDDLITEEMLERFVQEADELLQEFEQGLLKWADSIEDIEIATELFRNIHSFKGDCGFFGYADLERLSHQMETVLDAVRAKANMDKSKTAKVLLELIDVLKFALASISQGERGDISNVDIYIELLESLLPKGWKTASKAKKEAGPALGDVLIEQGIISTKDVDRALKEQRRQFGEILVEKGVVTAEQIEDALKTQKEKKPKPKLKAGVKEPLQVVIKRQDIRVGLDKLDSLINIIGELVIAENVVINNPDLDGLELENFHKAAQQMNKLVRELQEMAMTIRMLPVAGLFRRMIRLVHDLSIKSGKKVVLKLFGEDTELDKTLIETITDPLVHLIRNSMDHGLELPEERVKAGKSKTGTINLKAAHEEGEVWIYIEDDGRGLDREKILERAKAKGLIEDVDSELSDKQVSSLIFQPGFSTADKVTDISGRGVGLDVVLQNLRKINGNVEIKTKKGHGTKTVLRIPLTLAIIEGMLVRVDNAKFILPILDIKENFRADPDLITVTPDGQEIVRVREKFFPILRLHKVLNKKPDYQEICDGILIVIEAHEKSICLFVDEILGQQQTVIKGLSKYIGNIKGVSGCTILGNGEISLILDAVGLIEVAGE